MPREAKYPVRQPISSQCYSEGLNPVTCVAVHLHDQCSRSGPRGQVPSPRKPGISLQGLALAESLLLFCFGFILHLFLENCKALKTWEYFLSFPFFFLKYRNVIILLILLYSFLFSYCILNIFPTASLFLSLSPSPFPSLSLRPYSVESRVLYELTVPQFR